MPAWRTPRRVGSGGGDQAPGLALEAGVDERLLGLVADRRLAVDPLDAEPRELPGANRLDDRAEGGREASLVERASRSRPLPPRSR